VVRGLQQSGVGAEIAARIMEAAFDIDAAVTSVSGKTCDALTRRTREGLALRPVAKWSMPPKLSCTEDRDVR